MICSANRFAIRVASIVFSVVLVAVNASAAMTPHFTAKIYDLKDHSKHMFDYKSEVEVATDLKTFVNTVYDLQGEVLVVEKTVMKDDGKTLVSFEQDQKQLKTVGKVELRDGKAHFSFTKEDKTKTDEEKAGADFIVTSTLVAFVGMNWETIVKGDTVKARLAVLDRKETVGFQFRKESEKPIGGQSALVVKMKPSSLVISAMVNPLLFSFTADGKQLLELEGRTNVKVMVDGKFKDFDGYTVYSYPAAVTAPVGGGSGATPNDATPNDAKAPAKSKSKKKK